MENNINTIQPTIRKDCIDFVIVSNRGIQNITHLFAEAAAAPEKWMMHHFIVVYDKEEECKALKNWLNENREYMPLPKITACLATAKNARNVSALRQQGLEQGNNPYVYFQDDDDPLPHTLEQRIKIMESNNWVAVYGLTRSVSCRGQVVEEFPVLSQNNFVYDPAQAMHLFPTYAHPLAALFKRSLFQQIPMNDQKKYRCSGSNSFAVRLFMSGLPVRFLPDVIRTVHHHNGNCNGVFEKGEAKNLARDIQTWQDHVLDKSVKKFQNNIVELLLNNGITTYREIDARVEAAIEEGLLEQTA